MSTHIQKTCHQIQVDIMYLGKKGSLKTFEASITYKTSGVTTLSFSLMFLYISLYLNVKTHS